MILILLALGAAQPDPQTPTVQPSATAVVEQQTKPALISDDGFKVGVDTVGTITAKLGRPNSTETSSDGAITIRYIEMHSKIKGATFVPFYGIFAGGAKGRSLTKTFNFDQSGVLKSFASSKFETECKNFGGCH